MKLKETIKAARRVRVIVMQDDSLVESDRTGNRSSKSLTIYDADRDEVVSLIEDAVREAQDKDETE